jgi:RNA polymerase sigma-70 factor (ECF subfamily)
MAESDGDLIAATLSGNPQAFEEIVRRYQGHIFSIVYHYLGRRNEVEDLAQEVFIKVYRALPSFDTTRSLKAWVSRIAVNTCLDHLRKVKIRKTTLFSDLVDEEKDHANAIYEKFASHGYLTEEESDRAFGLLRKLLDRLSTKDKMAFVLREMEGLDYKEISKLMGSSQVAARIRVSRARKQVLDSLRQTVMMSG